MNDHDSQDPTDDDFGGATRSEMDAWDAPPVRPSAIERQVAAGIGMSAGVDHHTHQEAMQRALREHDHYLKHRRRRRFGVMSALVLILLVAIGIAFVYTEVGPPLRADGGRVSPPDNAVHTVARDEIPGSAPVEKEVLEKGALEKESLEKEVAAGAVAEQAAATKESLDQEALKSDAVKNEAVAKGALSQSTLSQSTLTENPSDNAAPDNAAPDAASPDALTIPIGDVSLRNRPELLEQLVQVYRSRLAANPADAAALAALTRLQEQSLAELETIVAEQDNPAAAKSIETASRLFPEQTYKLRYQYLVAQKDQQRAAKPASPAAPHRAISATTAAASTTATSSPGVAPTKTIARPAAAPAENAKNLAAETASGKPQVRVISVTPGKMVDQRFVPSAQGTAFMVEISYRNFENAGNGSDTALVALLGTPGDSEALAEVPVEITGDRGTKSFLMETFTAGNIGEKYRLNFLLNGEFLASSTVRLSASH